MNLPLLAITYVVPVTSLPASIPDMTNALNCELQKPYEVLSLMMGCLSKSKSMNSKVWGRDCPLATFSLREESGIYTKAGKEA